MFRAIIRSQLNLRKPYSVIYKMNKCVCLKFKEISLSFLINVNQSYYCDFMILPILETSYDYH